MKKIDLILKKVELFEKLAFYGRRQDFLKIAQNYYSFNPDSEEGSGVEYRFDQENITPAVNLEQTEYSGDMTFNPERITSKPSASQSANSLVNFYAAQVQAGIAKSDANLLDRYVPKLENAVQKAMLSKAITSDKYNQLMDLVRQAKRKEGDLAGAELDRMQKFDPTEI